ncbi:TRAP transporter substrate-binding protein [Salinicoccus halitifaciens]|uniref:Tripartite ATP-independent transporter DctP family solute receptor n=1 Tax=Salinicoccus halitifaciens TaxID=1073415 RepID=A0ABV2EB06_9STAP|nr:TRAP transporter substrate-binding protein [Salinicoccus halitifaciens]
MKFIRIFMLSIIAILSLTVIYIFIFEGDIVDSEEEVTIRFAHGQPETNERHLAVIHFKELVEDQSDMNVRIYPNEQLGSEAEMIESVTLNDLQMVAASAFSQYNPNISIFELPYLFDSYEEAWKVLDGEVGQEVAEPLLEDNLRIIAYFENGMRHVTANKKIEEPEDFNGLSIRTPEFPISLATFQALGANPTPMAFGELYMALQQGTVDAQENPMANTYTSRFQEVQEYLNKTSHQYMPLPVAISDDFWNSLSSEQQDIVETSAQEAAQYHRNLIVESEEQIEEELIKEGMEIVEMDTEPFREQIESVHQDYRDIYGDELLDKILEELDSE